MSFLLVLLKTKILIFIYIKQYIKQNINMGFIVNKKIRSSSCGELDSFYVRIENYNLSKVQGILSATVMAYTDEVGAQTTYPKYIGDPIPESHLIGGLIEFDESELDINELNYFQFHLTGSVDVLEDIIETQMVIEDVPTHDFDENGNIVEVVKKGEKVEKQVKVGEQNVSKTIIDLSPIKDTIYTHTYELVKGEYRKVFGNKSIEDLK